MARETDPNPKDRSPHPDPGFEQPAPPESTNYQHPRPPGTVEPVPGAGIVRPSDDAGPVLSEPDHGAKKHYPGQGSGPLNAPNATRPGTTRSGVSSVPDPAGASSGNSVTEEVTDGGEAPLSVPTDSVGPPEAPDVPELYDPNYTAASRPVRPTRQRERRQNLGPDARISDVMSTDLDYCEPFTPIQYVARMMADKDVGMIPVVQNTQTMKPIGTITDRDITVRVVAKNQDAASLRADQCMSTDVLTIRQNAPIQEASFRMGRSQVRRLLVVDQQGRLVGIISQGDIAEIAPTNETGELVRQVSEPG